MAIPVEPLARGSVDIAGQPVSFRSLSRREAIALGEYRGRENDAEAFIIAKATGITEDAAAAWLDTVSVEVGGALVDEILILSGLSVRDEEGSLVPLRRTFSPRSSVP